MMTTQAAQMGITSAPFGKTAAGENVQLYTLRNNSGIVAKITNYGGTITELYVPDREGKLANVVLGFDNLKQYEQEQPYFGAIIGRYANRIANAKFSLDGREHTLFANNGAATLHGGKVGFNRRVWKASPGKDKDKVWLKLSYTSPDGEEGFPGKLKTDVTYELNNDNSLVILYRATTDKATPISLTNHSYFNLSGAGSGDVLDHKLEMHASNYTPVDDKLIPTGEIAPVKGTVFDFTTEHCIGERISKVPGGGYDHNFVLDEGDKGGEVIALTDPKSGRKMTVHTTLPGVQLYTSNFLDGSLKGNGGTYNKHGAVCLETQLFPDSVHHDNFPNAILRPTEEWFSVTRYTFK